jgi:hypothetical protein
MFLHSSHGCQKTPKLSQPKTSLREYTSSNGWNSLRIPCAQHRTEAWPLLVPHNSQVAPPNEVIFSILGRSYEFLLAYNSIAMAPSLHR